MLTVRSAAPSPRYLGKNNVCVGVSYAQTPKRRYVKSVGRIYAQKNHRISILTC